MDVCCSAGAPCAVDYSPKGEWAELPDGGRLYVTGKAEAGRSVVAIYDIFGFDYPQFQQVCDRLGAAGLLVAAPDVFRGNAWSLQRFPPKPEDGFMDWLGGYSWEAVSKDVSAAVDALRSRGATSFGALGFCWGASIAAAAAASPPFGAVGFLHPSLFGRDEALVGPLSVPLLSISTPGDPYESLQDIMAKKDESIASKCVFRRYDDMVHGFCGARGDYSDPRVAAAAGEATAAVADFFINRL